MLYPSIFPFRCGFPQLETFLSGCCVKAGNGFAGGVRVWLLQIAEYTSRKSRRNNSFSPPGKIYGETTCNAIGETQKSALTLN